MGLSLWAFYQIADGKAVKLNYYESTERYENGYVASTTYSQNEAALSEAEYNSRLDADIGDASAYKTATVKRCLGDYGWEYPENAGGCGKRDSVNLCLCFL